MLITQSPLKVDSRPIHRQSKDNSLPIKGNSKPFFIQFQASQRPDKGHLTVIQRPVKGHFKTTTTVMLEQRQNKNDSIQSKIISIPRFFPHRILGGGMESLLLCLGSRV